MSKYEDAIFTIYLAKQDYCASEVDIENLNKVIDIIKQAEKQEKLLELYKQIVLLWERRYEYTNSVGEREKLWKIVKELENE